MQGQYRRTVFIVDDDDAVRDSMRALLESCDFEVRDFGSATDFLAGRNCSTCGARACLLLDLHMPVMGGLDLLQQMRAEGSLLPTIVITGRSDPNLKQRVLQSGAIELFDKPVSEDALLNAIDRAMQLNAGPFRASN